MSHTFIHLHLHSEYSLQDGIIRIPELINKVIDYKMPAVAITDISNLFAMLKFYQQALSAGIKPIIGSEVWVENEHDPNNHFKLILLCQNTLGYRNLTELISKSYISNQSNTKALIKKNWLKGYNQGLIAISPFEEGEIIKALINNHMELAETVFEYWSGIFDNRFYLEITALKKEGEANYWDTLLHFCEKKEALLVASNNVRFLNAEDFEAHEARVCIHQGVTLSDPNRAKNYTEEQYLKSSEQMYNLFKELPEALSNTVEIAKRCNLELDLNKVSLPNFPVPKGLSVESYFKLKAEEGLKERLKDKLNTVYTQRLQIELNVINPMGFAGYFLIVADFISWAKQNGIPVGPGRGSGAGSLVAYALQITDIDPLAYDLLFERFLNPERVSMPDFDIDFCMEGRDRVIEYVALKYGRESVSQIITFGTMAAKAVIRDVGRVLGHSYGFVDKIAKLIPRELGITLTKAINQEETLKERYEKDDEVKILLDLGLKLEGIIRNVGKHAGGLVIAPSKLTDFTPLYTEANEKSLLTQFDKNDVETIGLVKFDFLGLRTLTLIDWTVKTINQQKLINKPPLDISLIPLNDEKTFDLLKACLTTAVFQLESRGMKDLIRRLKPDNFEEIIALVALFRPGPLQSGMVDDFINRKHKRADIDYWHADIIPILKPTYGIILYQEQVMQIAQVLAGYTLGAADMLRRAMGKKKPEEMALQREIFTEGAIKRGVSHQLATTIFDSMEKFAGYGFNKSHSAAYALVTYQTAWLKAHYPDAFMAAVLSSEMDHTDKIVILIDECRLMGLKIISPDINLSQYKFSINDKNEIIYGLGAIKGLGEAAIQYIIDARSKEGPFIDIFDLCARVDPRKVSRRALEALILSGALDNLAAHRAVLLHTLEEAIQAAEQFSKNQLMGQIDLFGNSLSANTLIKELDSESIPKLSESQRLLGEKNTLGLYLTGHPIDQFHKELSFIVSGTLKTLRPQKGKQTLAGFIVSIRTLQTRHGDRMAVISLDDKTARQEVLIFADLYKQHKELLIKDALIIVEGEVGADDFSGGIRVRAISLKNLSQARLQYAKFLKISLEEGGAFEELMGKLSSHFSDKATFPIKVQYKRKDAILDLSLGNHCKINPTDDFILMVKNWIGPENVEVCYN
ncbi:MAG: dnaE [Francisellaceae bacterium]|nr:dnaE [Francisellaceae bacterium]